MKTIEDIITHSTSRVCRTYRTTDGTALLHVTEDRKVWLDCAGGTGKMTFVARLGDRGSGDAMTGKNARRAANQ